MLGDTDTDGLLLGIEVGCVEMDGSSDGLAEGSVDIEGISLPCNVGINDVVGWLDGK